MTWENEFRAHQVWAEREQCAADIAAHVATGDMDASEDSVRLVSAALARMQAFADAPDPLIAVYSLDIAAEIINQIRGTLPGLEAAFAAGPAGLYFRLAAEIRTWPVNGSVKLSGLTNQVTTLEQHLEGATTAMESAISDTRARADERIRATDEQSQQLLAEVAGSVTTLRAAVEAATAAAAQVTTTVEQEKARIDTAIREHQATFSTSEGDRSQTFRDQLEKVQQEWAEVRDEQKALAASHLAAMEEHERKSANVMGAVGRNSTATDFGLYADAQKRAANAWRYVAAVGFLAVGGVFTWVTVEWSTVPGDPWQVAATRVGLATALAAVGAYGARESGQHRREERRSKQVQLVLTALEPFLANLPPEKQIEIRTEAARAIFVLRTHEPSEETSPQSLSGPGDFLQIIHELTAKLPDSPK